MIWRNEYIFEHIIQQSGVTFPIQCISNTKKFKGFTELSKKLNISKSRVREIFIRELNKWYSNLNKKIYHWEDPRTRK